MLQSKTQWKKKKLKDICDDIFAGGTPSTNISSYWENGQIIWIPSGLIQDCVIDKNNAVHRITELGLARSSAKIIKENTTLLAMTGATCGKTAFLTFPAAANQSVMAFETSEINPKFLYYLFQENKEYILKFQAGGAQAGINKSTCSNFEFYFLKDKEKQNQIVNILSTCDKVIEKTEKTIEKYKQIKAGMMQDLFTRGVDANGKLRPTYEQSPNLYKYSEELDRYIPRDWYIKRLDEIAVILSGKDYKGNPKGNCNIPIYGTGGIMGYTTIPLYSGPAVLTGRKGSINTPYYVEGDFWNVDTIFCMKMLDDNDALWFYYQIYITDMIKYNEATGVPSTTSKTLNKILFAVPQPSEQIKIAQYIVKIDEKIEAEEQYLNKYKQIKQGLMKRLLTPPADAEIVEE
jgi:type I restriction enzyme S subunit